MNESIKKSLEDAGVELVEMPKPKFEYVSSTHAGDVYYFSGKTAQVGGVIEKKGKVGRELSTAEGREASRVCAINLLSQIEADIGLENVARILKVVGFVASDPDFVEQPIVINAASELLVQVLGERGKHARSAIGVAVLPGDSPVEVELILQASRTVDKASAQ